MTRDTLPTEIDTEQLDEHELRDWTVCPNCGSRDVWTRADRTDNTLALECRSCGESGVIQVGRPVPGGPAADGDYGENDG